MCAHVSSELRLHVLYFAVKRDKRKVDYVRQGSASSISVTAVTTPMGWFTVPSSSPYCTTLH